MKSFAARVAAVLVSIGAAQAAGSKFIAVTPCRVVDTRNGNGSLGGPALAGGVKRSFAIASSNCGIPPTAQAFSLNVTVVPSGSLSYLTVWPTGQTQPFVSTLNSFDGHVAANAALVPAGQGGSIDVFATDNTQVIIDINGYFDSQSAAAVPFFTVTPCRVVDTRNSNGALGGPSLAPTVARSFTLSAGNCNLPASAQAYSLNATVVPAGPLGFLSLWPAGQAQPLVSTLNSFDGRITANAAIVPAAAGAVSAFATDRTDLVLDTNGFFAATGPNNPLSFFPLTPCRVADTRNGNGALGGPPLAAGGSRSFPVNLSACAVPASAKAYALNVTAIPAAPLGFLTIWPSDKSRPLASTLNSPTGTVVANAAIVPAASDGSVSVFVSDAANVVLDINGYFAENNDLPREAQVTINNFAFAPTPVTVAAGGQVVWTNLQGVVSHTVVADGGQFASGVLTNGQTFTTMPATPGTYTYHCSIHPFMTGSLIVQ